MARNEIKLRSPLGFDHLERYRNYSALMERHRQALRRRRTIRFFTYSLIVTVIVVLFLIVAGYFVVRLEKKREDKQHSIHERTAQLTIKRRS